MGNPYRIGIIGLTPPTSWAAVAHLPALRVLEDKFRVVGVANSARESAQAAAKACGIDHAYDSAEDLVNDDDIDIVVVTVKAPMHYPLVQMALKAGKHVFCEWPLGNGFAETTELARLAAEANVRTVCGAQAPYSTVVRYVRDLVSQGYVGTVLSTSVVADGGSWGPSIPANASYVLDSANGATMLSVPIGHTLTGIATVLGPVETVQALMATRRESTLLAETGESVPLRAPDQIVVAATLSDGLPMSLHYRGGLSTGSGFRWEIIGTDGELEITGPLGAIEMVDLTVRGSQGADRTRDVLDVPDHYGRGFDLEVIPANVARLYEAFYNDLTTGSREAFSFDDAVRHHRVLAAIEESSDSGRRITI